jgi:hypothetical protein
MATNEVSEISYFTFSISKSLVYSVLAFFVFYVVTTWMNKTSKVVEKLQEEVEILKKEIALLNESKKQDPIVKVAKVKMVYTYGDSCGRYFAWSSSGDLHYPRDPNSHEVVWTVFYHKESKRILIGDENKRFICDTLVGEGHGRWTKLAVKDSINENSYWSISGFPDRWMFSTSSNRWLTNDGLNVVVIEKFENEAFEKQFPDFYQN